MCKILRLVLHDPQISFDTFSQCELSRFSGIYSKKEKVQWVPCVRISYSYYADCLETLQMLWRYVMDIV